MTGSSGDSEATFERPIFGAPWSDLVCRNSVRVRLMALSEGNGFNLPVKLDEDGALSLYPVDDRYAGRLSPSGLSLTDVLGLIKAAASASNCRAKSAKAEVERDRCIATVAPRNESVEFPSSLCA